MITIIRFMDVSLQRRLTKINIIEVLLDKIIFIIKPFLFKRYKDLFKLKS